MTRRSEDEWESFSDADVVKTCQLIQRTLADNAVSIPLGVIAMYRILDQVEAELELEIKTTFRECPH